MAIQNRYELLYYVACINANPNGDPDMGNTPRVDPQTITDVATKRRIRNYIASAYEGEPGMEIIVQQSTNLNRHIARAKREAGFEDCAKGKDAVYAGRRKACELFYVPSNGSWILFYCQYIFILFPPVGGAAPERVRHKLRRYHRAGGYVRRPGAQIPGRHGHHAGPICRRP